jgi:ABC-type uncharacterized transport system YnjBCD ATPase subunit
MGDVLHWNELQLGYWTLPSGSVCRGRHVRLVMDNALQYDFLNRIYLGMDDEEEQTWPVWLESGEHRLAAGSPAFCMRVGSMIRHRGLVANLSLRENLLLPFLYGAGEEGLARAEKELETVAEQVDLLPFLDEQAGERSAYTHALVSLGRCLLLRPDVIIAQEVHVGMSPERLARFRDLAAEALQTLGAGILYLTSTVFEGSGIRFEETLEPVDRSRLAEL